MVEQRRGRSFGMCERASAQCGHDHGCGWVSGVVHVGQQCHAGVEGMGLPAERCVDGMGGSIAHVMDVCCRREIHWIVQGRVRKRPRRGLEVRHVGMWN